MLFSSHVLAEVQAVADRVVIIDRGHVVHRGTAAELSGADRAVVVGSPDSARLGELAKTKGWRVRRDGRDRLVIHGASAAEVGRAAARAGIVLAELSTEPSTRQLEELFLQLTGTKVRP